jgi:uncharacterized protein (UPF0335 family)
MSTDLDGAADQQIASYVDRILRLREEADERMMDVAEVLKEAHGNGFKKAALKALVTELRKKAKNGEAVAELEADLDLYREAYNRAGVHAREEVPSWDAARTAARAA